MHKTDRIELLAPARDFACGKTAFDCGADAVYIGAGNFGSRTGVDNGIADIERLARYAHRYWGRVYVALNTVLLTGSEVIEAAAMIRQFHEVGVDGIIIRDLGLLELELPPIKLIASTQMYSNTVEKVQFLEKAGFRKVVLPMELSLRQIRAIRENTGVELEAFVHSQVCASYGGVCHLDFSRNVVNHLSCAEGLPVQKRSANLGACKSPCRRLKYSLVDSLGNFIARDKRLLNLKELSQATHLGEMIDSGISSFKIEGRTQDANYVKNIVSFYRRELDLVLNEKKLSRTSSGASFIDFAPEPGKTSYSTGIAAYTDLFINGRRSVGAIHDETVLEYLGNVTGVGDRTFEVETSLRISAGDKLCKLTDAADVVMVTVTDCDGREVSGDLDAFGPGDAVYRYLDHGFQETLSASVPKRLIDVSLTLTYQSPCLTLQLRDSDNIEAEVDVDAGMAHEEGVAGCQLSDLATLDMEQYGLKVQRVDGSAGALAKLSHRALDNLVRTAAERLMQKRVLAFERHADTPVKTSHPYPSPSIPYNAGVLNSYARAFFRRHGVTRMASDLESNLKHLRAETPPRLLDAKLKATARKLRGKKVMVCKYCLRHELGICKKVTRRLGIHLAEPLYLVSEENLRYRLNFKCSTCEMEVVYVEQSAASGLAAESASAESVSMPDSIRDYDSIQGWLSQREAMELYRLVQRIEKEEIVIAEIGSWKGKSAYIFARALQDSGKRGKVYCIDPFDCTGDAYSSGAYREQGDGLDIYDLFRANLAERGVLHLVEPIVKYSDDAIAGFDRKIDLLFIDGNHDEQNVLRDFCSWSPLLNDGGFIVFHDVGSPQTPGPKAVVESHLIGNDDWAEQRLVDELYRARKMPANTL